MLAIVVIAGPAPPLAAQLPTAADTADRPGFADSALVIGTGHVQIESGVLFERARADAVAVGTLTLPQLQVRTGLAPRLDVSFWWDGLVHVAAPGRDRDATLGADPRAGVKVQLLHRAALDLALVASAGLPVGSRAQSSGDADPSSRLCWSVAVTETLSLSGTVDVAEDRRDGLWRPRPALSAAAGKQFGGGVGAYAGLIVEAGDRGSSLQVWSAEAGVTRAIGRRRQLDVSGGHRLSGGASSWFVGGGFVQRIR